MFDLRFSKLDKVLLNIVWVLLALSIVLVFSDSMLRVIFGYSIFWLQEVILYFIVWSTMIGAGVAVRHDDHIKVDLLISNLSPKHQFIMRLGTYLVGLIFSSLFTYSGIKLVLEAYKTGIASITTLETPLWLPYLILPATGIIFVFGFCDLIWSAVAAPRENQK